MSLKRFTSEKLLSSTDTFTLVIDGKDMVPGRSETEEPSARDQVEILQKLVKIKKTEGWDIWVLFNGEPLQQVDHGGDFMGVRVFFSPTPPQRVPTLLECLKVLKKKNRYGMLITNDTQLETRARKQEAYTMRADTLKKGFDSLFVARSRPQSRLMRHRTVDRKKEESKRERDSAIRDMIDLVDD